MIGISRNRPGPFGGDFRRPSRKMTPRSYSRATRTDAVTTRMKRTAIAATAITSAVTPGADAPRGPARGRPDEDEEDRDRGNGDQKRCHASILRARRRRLRQRADVEHEALLDVR